LHAILLGLHPGNLQVGFMGILQHGRFFLSENPLGLRQLFELVANVCQLVFGTRDGVLETGLFRFVGPEFRNLHRLGVGGSGELLRPGHLVRYCPDLRCDRFRPFLAVGRYLGDDPFVTRYFVSKHLFLENQICLQGYR
jgi:hypothetical protein